MRVVAEAHVMQLGYGGAERERQYVWECKCDAACLEHMGVQLARLRGREGSYEIVIEYKLSSVVAMIERA